MRPQSCSTPPSLRLRAIALSIRAVASTSAARLPAPPNDPAAEIFPADRAIRRLRRREVRGSSASYLATDETQMKHRFFAVAEAHVLTRKTASPARTAADDSRL